VSNTTASLSDPYSWHSSLTPWNRVVLEKLIVTQLVKEFNAFYETRRFITVFTRACHWSLFWARCIHFTLSHPNSLRSILILSSHLRPTFPSGHFLSYFPTKILYTFHISPMRATWPLSRSFKRILPGPRSCVTFYNTLFSMVRRC
jgi:hypothetical protein